MIFTVHHLYSLPIRIPEGWMGLDVGPKSVLIFEEVIERANQILWNGPAGVFEMDKFEAGTVGKPEALSSKRLSAQRRRITRESISSFHQYLSVTDRRSR